MKTCAHCRLPKPLDEFSKSARRKDGHDIYCRGCIHEKYVLRKDKHRESVKNWHKTNPDQARAHQLMYNYGITIEQYQEMLAAQNGKCRGCGAKPDCDLCVDHDHQTGRVRGLLCGPCNRAIGLCKDSPQVLATLSEYLAPACEWLVHP